MITDPKKNSSRNINISIIIMILTSDTVIFADFSLILKIKSIIYECLYFELMFTVLDQSILFKF